MKKTNNERNAGRKPKYTCKTVLKRIPILIEKEVEMLANKYLTNNSKI